MSRQIHQGSANESFDPVKKLKFLLSHCQLLLTFHQNLPLSSKRHIDNEVLSLTESRVPEFCTLVAEAIGEANLALAEVDGNFVQNVDEFNRRYKVAKSNQATARFALISALRHSRVLFAQRLEPGDEGKFALDYDDEIKKLDCSFQALILSREHNANYETELAVMMAEFAHWFTLIDLEEKSQENAAIAGGVEQTPYHTPRWGVEHPIFRVRPGCYSFSQIKKCVIALYANFESVPDDMKATNKLYQTTQYLYDFRENDVAFKKAVESIGPEKIKQIVFSLPCSSNGKSSAQSLQDNEDGEPDAKRVKSSDKAERRVHFAPGLTS